MRRFKWEWRVTYEFNWTGEWEAGHYELFRSRKEARHFIRNQMYIHRGMIRPAPATCFRNIKIQRRLIEVDWHDYRDSFTWNRGRGKR